MAFVNITDEVSNDDRLKRVVEFTINYFKFIQNVYVDLFIRQDGKMVLLKLVHQPTRRKEIVAIEKQSLIDAVKVDNFLSFSYDSAMKKIIGL
jgi:hypothetical protein